MKSCRLIPVVSLSDVNAGVKLGGILDRYGMEVVEVTFRTSYAAEGISRLKKRFPKLLVLAGTVLTPDQVDAALNAGAEGMVSPGLDPALVNFCQERNIPIFPGVCTPSEVQHALSLGLTKFKFFPAELSGGINMVNMLLGVYRMISLMPTGGINPGNLQNYLGIDRVLCCGATWLTPQALMAVGDWAGIEQRVKEAAHSLEGR
ncbi:MAG: bifunctional 4-hydroxy-2-oxoglutarate aldolase/2-dehydro-3-deoxy-phosphogluconate aldolase [Desulfobacterales bacterium]|nr:bifunctional 4-hydroxy-2-oxoglutarate aldolase/2-dehydro-3-deoxy-phosphogluconate aldolase [Deltaproteobacteria bacterium]NNK95279.1 bifunctional 4-hydroxy-2-oxoglutarate aldolase/2-dehydro-3-deoxy-phosphogluconate aldolase [Desulfobacterales bacterium]